MLGELTIRFEASYRSIGAGRRQNNEFGVVLGHSVQSRSCWIWTSSGSPRDAVEKAIAETVRPPNLSRFAIKGKNIYRQIERGNSEADELMMRLMAIPQQCSVPVFYHAVHLEGFPFQMTAHRQQAALNDAFRPFRLAFQHCMEKVDTYVHARYRDEEVLWIHDAGSLDGVTKHSLRDWRAWLEEVTQEITNMKENRQAPAEIEPHVSHVADMIYFGNAQGHPSDRLSSRKRR